MVSFSPGCHRFRGAAARDGREGGAACGGDGAGGVDGGKINCSSWELLLAMKH